MDGRGDGCLGHNRDVASLFGTAAIRDDRMEKEMPVNLWRKAASKSVSKVLRMPP